MSNWVLLRYTKPTEADGVTYPEPRIHVVYEELEMDDLWRLTSLHREETI